LQLVDESLHGYRLYCPYVHVKKTSLLSSVFIYPDVRNMVALP
jgi:hypothetical protein